MSHWHTAILQVEARRLRLLWKQLLELARVPLGTVSKIALCLGVGALQLATTVYARGGVAMQEEKWSLLSQ